MSKAATDREKELKELGARFRAMRKAKGHSNQEIFAYKIGIGRSIYSRYERGETEPGYLNLNKIIKGLEMTKADFFAAGFEESPPDP